MQNNAIEQQILRYLDDGFENSDYMAEIVTALPLPEICNLICELLRSEDFDTLGMAGLFLSDTMLIGRHSNDCTAFSEHFPDSKIVKTLEELVFSDKHFVRQQVIYTLGKTCSYASAAALSRAFELYRDTDPLLLDRLIGEMIWLEIENIDDYIHSLVNSSNYLNRWAVAGVLHPIGNNIQTIYWAEALRKDECELIRIEAEYEYQCKLKSLQTPILSKLEQRQRAKDIKKIKPLLSFWDVQFLFEKYLSQNDMKSYTVADLEGFVTKLWDERQSSQPLRN